MDPRRARDPRLARADPRLQNRPPSNSPAPAAPAPADGQQYTSQSNSPQEGGPTNNQQSSVPGLGVPGPSNYQVESAQTSTPVPPTADATQASQLQKAKYKPKPMFCVVCASNQVITWWY